MHYLRHGPDGTDENATLFTPFVPPHKEVACGIEPESKIVLHQDDGEPQPGTQGVKERGHVDLYASNFPTAGAGVTSWEIRAVDHALEEGRKATWAATAR